MIGGLALLAVRHLVLLTALALAAAALGDGLLRAMRIGTTDPLERWAYAGALGLGVIAYFVLALGLLGRLTPGWTLGGVTALALACAPWSRLARMDRRTLARGALWTLALALVTAPIWGRALAPPLDWDAPSYHVAAAKQYAVSHAFGPTVNLRYAIFTELQEMLFTLALVARTESVAAGTQTLATVFTALAFLAAGRRAGAPRAGLFAAALWLGSPLVVHLSTSGYIDCGLALYTTLAITTFLAWLDSGERAAPLLAGAFAGLAAASKHTGLIVAALGALGFATAGRPRRATLVFCAAAALVGAPFYLLNAHYTGNPVFPFAASWFGHGPYWNDADMAGQLENLAQMGTGRSLAQVLLLPWRLAFGQGPLTPDGFWISPAYVLFTPLTLWLAWRHAGARRLLALVFAFGVIWFVGAPATRYLLPVLPALALAHGLALDRLWGARRGAALFAAGLAAWGLLDGAWQCVSDLPPAPSQRSAWLSAHRPAWQAVELLNRAHPGYRIYQIGSEDMAYFADGVWLGDAFGPWRWSRVVPLLGDPRALLHELRAMDVQFFMLAPARMAYLGIPRHPTFDEHFEKLLENEQVILYALR